MGNPGNTIRLHRVFKAPVERVFRAFNAMLKMKKINVAEIDAARK